MVVALVVSWFTGMNKPSKMDPDVLSPVIHKYISFLEEKEMVNIKLMQGHKVALAFMTESKSFLLNNFHLELKMFQDSIDIRTNGFASNGRVASIER